MEKNELRVKFDNLYTIEVNDKGETIEFNLEDVELPLKMQYALEKIEKIKQYTEAQEMIISKQSDAQPKYGLSKNKKARLELYTKAFKDMRAAMDEFLGKDGCQKIFGDRNSFSMFDKLFEQLEPHIKKMGIENDAVIKSIEKKYTKESNDDIISDED